MIRLTTTLFGWIPFVLTTYGQLKEYYFLERSSSYDTIDFYFTAKVNNCQIQKSHHDQNPLSVYANLDPEKTNISFDRRVFNNTCYAKLNADEFRSGFEDRFSFAFSSLDKERNFWKVLFSDDKIYKLNLKHGFGNADINLAGFPIQKFKLKSGSADIIIGFEHGTYNPIEMDTFFVKTDFGSITTKHLEMSRAGHVITKVGFGNVLLDFDTELSNPCRVDASVGAGNLEILLPEKSSPVIIYVRDSPLCSIRLTENFEEVEPNVFVNDSYTVGAENLLTFDLDVALGQVKFSHID